MQYRFEVEKKYYLPDAETVLKQLAGMDVDMSEPIEQVDRYFGHPSRDFEKTDEALRLRLVEGKTWLTYKGARIDETTKTRRELDLPLGVGEESLAAFEQLLKLLDFKPVMIIRKFRQSGSFQWQDHDVTVCIDEVDPLGMFVELETHSDLENLDQAKAALDALSTDLRLDRPERRSYLELMLQQLGPSQLVR